MTWLTGASQTAGTTASTGGSLAQATTAAQPAAVASGAIGQTGITGGMSTPALSQFPQQSADLAKFAAHPLDTAFEYLKSQAQARMGGGDMSGAGQSGGTPPQTSGAGGILHGMLSGRKTQAPSSGTGEQPAIAPRPRKQYQTADNAETMQALLQSVFGGR